MAKESDHIHDTFNASKCNLFIRVPLIIKLQCSSDGWLTLLLILTPLTCAAALPRRSFVCVCSCVRVCPLHPALAPISATNMSSVLHDSVQALAGDGLEHGVPLGQTGL